MSTGGPNRGRVQNEEPNRAQRTVARRAAESRATVPDLELRAEIEMTACLAWSETHDSSLIAAVIRACAAALRAVPRANGSYRDEQFELYERVNIGLVVPTPDALSIPVLFDADRKSAQELTGEAERLTERATSGTLTAPEQSGATFTFSDVGAHGVASASPVIVPPHAAAVAAGTVRHTPIVRDRELVPGRVMTLTLAVDHRILYGLLAYRFLEAIKARLETADE